MINGKQMIKWLTTMDLTVYSPANDNNLRRENIQSQRIETVTIFSEKRNNVDIQFGNGDISCCVSKKWFKIIPQN